MSWRQSLIEPFVSIGAGLPETTSTSWVGGPLITLELHSNHLHLRFLTDMLLYCPMAFEIATEVPNIQVFVKNPKSF